MIVRRNDTLHVPRGRRLRRGPALLLSAVLLLAAHGDNCTMSLGANGLCAHLQLGADRDTVRVGQQLRIEVNAAGCSAPAGCSCLSDALAAASWQSSVPATAAVSPAGVVQGLSPGATDILLVPGPDAAWTRVSTRITVVP